MNKKEIKSDFQALCEKHKIMMYADENEPCTVIEQLLSAEESDAGVPPERLRLEFVTSETFSEY